MKKTRLDVYRKHYESLSDGETVLFAAATGHFRQPPTTSEGVALGTFFRVRDPGHEGLLEKAGIRYESCRHEIVKALREKIDDAIGLDQVVEEELARKMGLKAQGDASNITVLDSASSESSLREARRLIREEIMHVFNAVLKFCEEEVEMPS